MSHASGAPHGDGGAPASRLSGFETALLLVGAALAGAHAGWQILAGGTDAQQTLASNVATPALSIIATILAWRAARAMDGHAGVAAAWRRLAAAFLCMAFGDAVWAVGESGFGVEPTVGWHDVPYLASYPLLLWGLLSFPPRFRHRNEQVRFWLDSLTVLVGGGMLLWYFILYPTATRTGADPLARGIALSYLVGDLVLLFGIATTLLRRPPQVSQRPLGLLVTGVLLQLGGDLALAEGALLEDYATGGLTDALWVLSYAFVAGAAWVQLRDLSVDPSPRWRGRDLRALPYAAIALGYGLLLVVAGRDDSPATLGLIIGAVLLTALVVARQVLALSENQRLARELAERRSEARFRSLVQNSSDVVTILDAAGRIVFHSPAADRILGLDIARAVGRPFVACAVTEDEPKLAAFLEAARHSQRGITVEWRLRGADGRWVHLESTASDLLDDPTVAGIVVNTRDITERKELEQKLGQAMKMEAIGRLAGGVAHDFNNLLTVIQGHAALLLDRLSGDVETRAELEEIERAGRRAAALTRQLLAFSRKQVLQPRTLDANEAIRDMQRMLRRLIRENIEIVVVLHEGGACIQADPSQFEQVVLNLCVNAGDAMPAGGRLTIRTATELRDDGGSFLVLTVADTGSGMDESTLARIFEPFFTTKPTGEGTGLGLSTVYGIIEQSGGTIEVESAPGAGTNFRVRLPRSPAPCDAGIRSAPVAAATGRETVLLVEDEAGVRALARKTLELNGYDVLEAADGEAALALLHGRGSIDLLLTDVIMPRMGGPELALRVRSLWPEVRVLYMSGYTDDEAITHGTAGARRDGFLQKPFTPGLLAARVRDILDGVSRTEAADVVVG